MTQKENTKKVMFENRKIEPVFTDDRGSIFDLIEEKVSHVGIITFNKGVTRANHYHKESVQYSYILEGKIKLAISDIDGTDKKEIILEPGMLTTIPPKMVHVYTALSKAVMIDITTMSRKDNGYEEDTVRMSIK